MVIYFNRNVQEHVELISDGLGLNKKFDDDLYRD